MDHQSNHIRVVVGGSRYTYDKSFVFETLDLIHAQRPIKRLAHGDCEGADTLANQWAQTHRIECIAYPANWNEYPDGDPRRRTAGPRRNEKMLSQEKPDLVIAFPGGRGTRDLIRQAMRMGLEVMEVAKWNKNTA